MTEELPHGHGVYFHRDAYAGLGRRVVIVLIDLVVLWIGSTVAAMPFLLVINEELDPIPTTLQVVLAGWFWFYLVIIKSFWGTVGFWLTKVQIVDSTGKRPSIPCMTLRLFMLLGGPLHPLLDLLWAGGDESRQTIRDKFCGTYIIRKNTQPAGNGPMRVRLYFTFSGVLPLSEIHRIKQPDSLAS